MAKKHSAWKPPHARMALGANARYDAAGTGRRMSGWNTPASGPNQAIVGLQKVRDRARDVQRNEWAGASNARIWKTNLVGTGIVPRPTTKNATLKQKLTELWDKWAPVADADQILDFYGLQALVAGTWFSGGEAFVRLRPRRIEDGLPVPLQIQVLEADMVPLLDADVWPGMPVGNTIRSGIELDKIGRRAAFWMYRAHPGDNHTGVINASDLVRVPAASVLHVYEPTRPGQMRGVPEMASVIAKLRNVGDFDDANLERQRLANLFTLFVTKAVPTGNNDIMTGMPAGGSLDEPLAGLEPGIAQELLPGEDVRFSDPPDAGTTYAEFMRMQHLGVSAGAGTPYELSTGDIQGVSDRTLRIVVNEFRRLCEQRQWLMFIPQMLAPIRDAWADAAYLGGALTLAESEEAKKVKWSPQGWQYIHPVQDVQAKQTEVEAGFRSRSSVIAERGDDPDAVDQERADDKKREDSLGLTPPVPVPGDPNAPSGNDPAKPANDPQKKKANASFISRIVQQVLDLIER